MIAPKVFQLDEIDGHSQPVSEDVPVDQERMVAEAVRSCPEQAITAWEDPTTCGCPATRCSAGRTRPS
jgi:ferredoxin